MPGPCQRSAHGEADRLQRARRWSLARWPGRWQRAVSAAVGGPVTAAPTRCRLLQCAQAAAPRCPRLARGCQPPGEALWPAEPLTPTKVHQSAPLSAACQCGGWCGVAARLPLRLCRAARHWFPMQGQEPPHSPPLGERGIPPPRKVEGLFPARLGEHSRAAAPVKATPCGWLEDSPALTEPAALPPCVVAWPEKCRCGHRPRQAPAWRASVALPLVAAACLRRHQRPAGTRIAPAGRGAAASPGGSRRGSSRAHASAPMCWSAWCSRA